MVLLQMLVKQNGFQDYDDKGQKFAPIQVPPEEEVSEGFYNAIESCRMRMLETLCTTCVCFQGQINVGY